MSGLPIHLTNNALYLGGLDVTEWTQAGSVSLKQVEYIGWELSVTLDVVPVERADLAVTTDGTAVGEDRPQQLQVPPVALPTTPGSVIKTEDGTYLALQRDGWWCDEFAEKTGSHWYEVVFDAGAA